MDTPIKNSWDLKQEIIRLRELEQEKSIALKERFNSPMAVFSTVYSLFPSSNREGGDRSNIFNQDFVSILSRILLPITLNKTIFRKSGFLMKAIVGLLSQKASAYINEESVSGIWDKIKSLFKGKDDAVHEKYPYGL